jgi:hypothetical protein
MKKTFLFLIPFSLININAFAQKKAKQKVVQSVNTTIAETKQKANEKSKTILGGFFNTDIKEPTRWLSITAQANNNGWSGGLQLAKQKSKTLKNAYFITLSEIKHDKEAKLKSTMIEVKGYGKPLTYIYGKQNSFYTFNIGFEQQRLLLKGIVEPSVNVSLVYGGSFSLGLLKPYYLKLKHSNSNGFTLQDEKYSLANNDTFLLTNNIYSRSAFRYQWQETKLNYGLQLFIASQIDIGKSSIFTKAIRFGTSASFFSNKIPIMIEQQSKPYLLNVFMGVIIGKGW